MGGLNRTLNCSLGRTSATRLGAQLAGTTWETRDLMTDQSSERSFCFAFKIAITTQAFKETDECYL